MSKLFDQLKNAARTREEKSPGLLLEALKSKGVAPASAGVQSPDVLPAKAGSQAPIVAPPPAKPSPYAGIVVAAAILGVVFLVWNANPWRPPAKVKIDPSGLKLERSLDLKRPSSEGTSPPARPS